jgi:hypothetical protein
MSITKMKYEWKKQEKELYLPKDTPMLITVPKHKVFAIKGKGNPNESDFAERISVLYSLAYAVRMMPKSGFTPDGYFEYTVYPLEGVWETNDVSDKNSYIYTIMIRQPDFVTAEVVEKAFETVNKKRPHAFLDEACFCEIEDGLSVQIMHIGDYDNEPINFAKMQKFMEENNLVRRTDNHREIYLSDANKVAREKLRTVLRYSISRKQ